MLSKLGHNLIIILSLSGTTLSTTQQAVRVATPGPTILKAAGGQGIGGAKQIITVHKAGSGISGTGQPQIVTLVKTTQGMQVATVSILMSTILYLTLLAL